MPGVRSLFYVSLCVCALWLSACRSTCCPKGAVPSKLMVTEANGTAYFVDADPDAPTRYVAKLQVDGGWTFTEHFSKLEEVVAVHVFAAPGSPEAKELATCANLVYTLPRPPARWSSPWIEGRWDSTTVRYRVLVRTVFQSEGELLYADRTIDGMPIVASKVTKGVPEAVQGVSPGDNEATAGCTGTFDGAQNLALYDLDVIYDAEVDRIEVYAKPADDQTSLPNPAFLVHIEQDPPLRGWHPTGLAGPYNGSSAYAMLIQVHFVSGTPPYVDRRGKFEGITPGTPVLLE